MKKKGKVLLYHLPAGTESGDAVRRVLEHLSISLRVVGEHETGKKIRSLLLEDAEDKIEKAEGEPILVIEGLEQKELDSLLMELKKEGAKVPLKAVVTEHNRNWSFERLAGELKNENAYFALISELQLAIGKASLILQGGKKLRLEAAVSYAKQLISQQETEPKIILDAIVRLNKEML